ncbi:unnamed protein product [Musa acuminata subsp. burmannicoides]
MTYINLQLNCERHDGYAGPSSQRIWTAIYKDKSPHSWWECPSRVLEEQTDSCG